MQRFLALFDAHVGFEPSQGRLKALHDSRCLDAVLGFASDFKPHHLILGGDMLDCGPISHHRKGKVGELEGLRLVRDAEILQNYIEGLEATTTGTGRRIYHLGNHEDWLAQLTDELPGMTGLLDIKHLVKLPQKWEVVPQGGVSKLGKLHFLHGDQISSTVNPAKWAVEAYEKSVRFGHFHTYSAYSKIAALSDTGHTGVAVPCLCKKDPNYGGGSPNRWVNGFLYGYVDEKTGHYTDSVVTMVNGKFMALGKKY
jgi:hypothetical protein